MNDVELRIPFKTLLKVALFVLLALIVIRLYTFFLMLFVAVLVAVVLDAATEWLQHHGVRRGLALFATAGAMFGLVAVFLIVIVPDMIGEMRTLIRDAPRIAQIVSRKLPMLGPYLTAFARELQRPPNPNDVKQLAMRGAVLGQYVLDAVSAVSLVLVTAVYLVVEGKRAFAWLVSFAPDEQRKKIVQTAEEVQPVMLAYMRGQLVTSTLSALAAAAALVPLHVPAAIPLAVLAFVGDFIPVVGFIASIIPAILLAFLRGPTAALIVAAAYVGYQALENYIISPRVYGKAMRLSTLTVLISIVVGGILAGPIGAILMLPLAAAYPAIERIWLRRHLPDETVESHDRIESDDDAVSDRATDEVLRG